MSTALSIQPDRHSTQRDPRPRHIEIAPTRTQKKARPKVFYALVTVGGLFAILLAQLILSIVVSDGAYQISGLQQQQKELARDQQSLSEELQVLESPQHLAVNAEQLGMVASAGTAYLNIADGTVIGDPVAASATDGIALGPDGASLVPNELLAGVPLTGLATTPGTTAVAGAPESALTGGSITSSSQPTNPQGLPSPITR